MITTNDIKTILINDLKETSYFSGISISKDVHAPVKEDNNFERIVVVLPGGVGNGILSRSLPRICFYIPDLIDVGENGNYYRPNNGRLNTIESFCVETFKCGKSNSYNGYSYYYQIENLSTESDPETWSHFVNMQLIFKVISKNEIK